MIVVPNSSKYSSSFHWFMISQPSHHLFCCSFGSFQFVPPSSTTACYKMFPSLKWQIPFPLEMSPSSSSFIPPIFFHGHWDKPLCLPGAPWIPAVFLLSTQKCHPFPFWRAEHGCGTEASVDVRWSLQLVSISCCERWACVEVSYVYISFQEIDCSLPAH